MRLKLGLGIRNRNQGQISVGMLEPKLFFFHKRETFFKFFLFCVGKKALQAAAFSADLWYIIIYVLPTNLTLNSARQEVFYAI